MEIAISTGLDILIVAVFILCIVFGIRNGFVKSVISLVGNIAALAIAFIFSVSLGAYINTNYVREPMQQWLINSLSPTEESTKASLDDLDLDQLFADMPTFFKDSAEFLGVDIEEMQQKYESLKENGVEQAKAAIVDAMTNPVSEVVSRAIAFVLIFIACSIAVRILWWLSDLIVNIPVIRQIDKTGGAVLGIINGILITFILTSLLNVTLVYFLRDKTPEQRETMIENTVIYKRVDDVNPLNKMFKNW